MSSPQYSIRSPDSDLVPRPARSPAGTGFQVIIEVAQTFPPDFDPDDDFGATGVVPSVPPAHTGSQEIIDELKTWLQLQNSAENCCCGGSIPIQVPPPAFGFEAVQKKSTSAAGTITLRFDKVDGSVSKIHFPLLKDSKSAIQELSQACSPFGSVKDARELKSTHFSLNFHPVDLGVVDTIAQVLLPWIRKDEIESVTKEQMVGREEHWGVRAELSGLIIYYPSTSSQAFRRKLDIPTKGEAHLGTLIICLPVPHKGGDILITQNEQTTNFPSSSSTTVPWIAFTNNLIPILTPLISGHLVLLTYHLLLTPSVGDPLHCIPSADPYLYPLHSKISVLLSNPAFLPEGGVLGLYLRENSQSHTRRNTNSHLPYSLRGVDLIFFAVCASLGLNVNVRPVLGDEAWDEYEEAKRLDPEEELGEDGNSETPEVTRVGLTFARIKMADIVMRNSEDPTLVVNRFFPLQEYHDIFWLNEARHESWEIQLVNLKTSPPSPDSSFNSSSTPTDPSEEGGSETCLMWHYTHPAILVNFPPSAQRGDLKGMKDFPDWGRGGERGEVKGKFKIVIEDYS